MDRICKQRNKDVGKDIGRLIRNKNHSFINEHVLQASISHKQSVKNKHSIVTK